MAVFLVCTTFAARDALPWILRSRWVKLTHLLYCICVRTKSVVEQHLANQLACPQYLRLAPT